MMKSRVSQEYTENCLALLLYLGHIWADHNVEQPGVKAEVYVESLPGWGWTTMPTSPKDHAAIWRHSSDPSSNLGNKYHCG